MNTQTFAGRICETVASWDGVTITPHRMGGVAFRIRHREIGHLHGEVLADLPFPVHLRRALVAAGRALPHHALPASGWVSHPIHSAADASAVIELLRFNYERLRGGSVWRPGVPAFGTSLQLVMDASPDNLLA